MANELEKTLLGKNKRSVNNTVDKNSTYIEQKKLHKVFVQEEDPGEVEDGCIWLDTAKKKIIKQFPVEIKFEKQAEGSPELGSLVVGYIIDRENIQNPIYMAGSNSYCLDISDDYPNVFELSGFNSSSTSFEYRVYYYLGIRQVVNDEIKLCSSHDTTQFNTRVYAINGNDNLTLIDSTAPFSMYSEINAYLNYNNVNDANIIMAVNNNLPTYLDIHIVQ